MPYWVKEDREVTTKFLSDLNEQTAFTALGANYVEQLKAAMNYSPLFKIKQLNQQSDNTSGDTSKEEIITEDMLLRVSAFAVANTTKVTITPVGVWDAMNKKFIKDVSLYDGLLKTTVQNHYLDFNEISTIYFAYSGAYFPVAHIQVELPEVTNPLVNDLVLSNYLEDTATREDFLKGSYMIIVGGTETQYIVPWLLFK